jgi:hypothetical protein
VLTATQCARRHVVLVRKRAHWVHVHGTSPHTPRVCALDRFLVRSTIVHCVPKVCLIGYHTHAADIAEAVSESLTQALVAVDASQPLCTVPQVVLSALSSSVFFWRARAHTTYFCCWRHAGGRTKHRSTTRRTRLTFMAMQRWTLCNHMTLRRLCCCTSLGSEYFL